MATTLIRNATILTMNDALEIIEGAVMVRDGRILSVGAEPSAPCDHVINAGGDYLLPGFIQTHVHLCQTLFRSYADDMPLLEWLQRRIWPMEAAHSPSTLRAAVRLAAAELLLSGTTTALTMETVHDTDVVFETLADVGLRATVGKCMMDSDDNVPSRLREDTQRSIDESVALRARWDGAAHGRLRAAFAPRFAVSCSRRLLEAVAALSASDRVIVHTHASESRDEVDVVAPAVGRALQPRIPERDWPRKREAVRRALRLGQRRRAGADGGARRQGDALPRVQPQARLRASRRSSTCGSAESACRSAPTAPPATTASTCSMKCVWPPRSRRCAALPAR